MPKQKNASIVKVSRRSSELYKKKLKARGLKKSKRLYSQAQKQAGREHKQGKL